MRTLLYQFTQSNKAKYVCGSEYSPKINSVLSVLNVDSDTALSYGLPLVLSELLIPKTSRLWAILLFLNLFHDLCEIS